MCFHFFSHIFPSFPTFFPFLAAFASPIPHGLAVSPPDDALVAAGEEKARRGAAAQGEDLVGGVLERQRLRMCMVNG